MVFSCDMRASREVNAFPRLQQNVTPPDSIIQCMETTLLIALGRDVQPALEFSHVFNGVIGSCDHALALTSLRRHDQSRVPSLVRPFDRRQRYYEPLGLPPSTIPFRHRLIGTAFARRGPPGRVSPVPYQAVLTCPPPYPVGVLQPSGSRGCSLLPSSWDERLGHPSLSGFYVTRLQGSPFDWARQLASLSVTLRSPQGFRRSAQTISLSTDPPEPATRRSGAYRDGTFTR